MKLIIDKLPGTVQTPGCFQINSTGKNSVVNTGIYRLRFASNNDISSREFIRY